MAKIVSNETAVEDTENRESDMINSDIEEFMTLRESMANSNKTLNHWMNQTSKLLESNSNIEMSYDKILMKVSSINERISDATKIYTTKKQELEDFQDTRMISLHKQWDNFLSESRKYADNFCQWMTEYRSNVLMKDIENHHKKCKKVADSLAALKQEVDNMMKREDSDYIETNIDITDLSNLNTVTSDIRRSNNNLTRIVGLTEVSLSKIQNKIEQCKVAVSKYKMKENTNKF